jgi:methylated-DNA-[protein]-cysteine S-methyltransferase
MRNVFYWQTQMTPLGALWVTASESGLIRVDWPCDQQVFLTAFHRRYLFKTIRESDSVLPYCQEIEEYLAGARRSFDQMVDWSTMEPFQELVLRRTYVVPYGEVLTYAEIARQVGHPGAARAVGRAQATNPMPLVIPCHRAVGTDGRLHGYGGPGDIQTKEWLLCMEGVPVEGGRLKI